MNEVSYIFQLQYNLVSNIMSLPPQVIIKENSLLAKIAAFKLKSRTMALVLGNTIHLFGVTKQQFLQNTCWVRHELKHVEQYKRYGIVCFLLKYLGESIRKGYYQNKYEVEARMAENEKS